jgi:hypothetical protein
MKLSLLSSIPRTERRMKQSLNKANTEVDSPNLDVLVDPIQVELVGAETMEEVDLTPLSCGKGLRRRPRMGSAKNSLRRNKLFGRWLYRLECSGRDII